MQPQGEVRDLRQRLREVLQEADRLAAQIEQTEDRARHAARPERRRLTLIRGGKALVLAPLAWVWSQVRDHAAQASTLAAVGVVGVPTALGVATPVIHPGAPPVSIGPRIMSDIDPSPLPERVTSPQPEPTPTVEVVEPEVSPPDPPAPTSAPTPLPTPTPTVTPPLEAVEPVEEIVWTKAEALVHCREVLLADDLRGCVRELLAG
jgi:hypothetical protein